MLKHSGDSRRSLGNLKAEDLACEVINQAMKRWPSCANFRARPDRYLAMPE